ncbi:MAG: nuclear transport factor 2 family protein [Acidimicrobiales bacterium]
MTANCISTDTAVLGSRTVDRFLEAIAGGDGIPTKLFADDAVLDATVPGWRFPLRGAARLCDQYDGWFRHPGTFEELERLAVDGGEVVTYLLTWLVRGVPHAAHHIHVLRFDASGRIAADRFFCGGQWDAALLAKMAAESDDAG